MARRRCAPQSAPGSATLQRGRTQRAAALRHAHLGAGRKPELRPQRARQAHRGRPAHRAWPAATRRGAPARRCSRSARRPRAPGRAARAPGAGDARRGVRWTGGSRRRRRPALRRAPASALSWSKPGRPSRLPSTRSTFQAGRVSPSGLDHAVEALHPALGIDEGAGGFGERRDRQQHVGVVDRGIEERRQRHDQARAFERGARGRGVGTRRAPARRSAAAAPSSAATASGRRAGPTARAARAPIARRRCWRPRRSSRRWRRSARRSSAPAPAACSPADAARRRCRAARPCVRPTAVGRRWLSPRRGLRRLRARSRPCPAPPPRPRRPAPATQALGAAVIRCATGIAQSSCTACRLITLPPRRAAWRMRGANSGWSLRRNEPITNTRSSDDSAAIGMPSQRARPSGARLPKSLWRRRWSMFSLPRPRTSLASRCSSSSVLCGEPSAPMLGAPYSALMRFRPSAT